MGSNVIVLVAVGAWGFCALGEPDASIGRSISLSNVPVLVATCTTNTEDERLDERVMSDERRRASMRRRRGPSSSSAAGPREEEEEEVGKRPRTTLLAFAGFTSSSSTSSLQAPAPSPLPPAPPLPRWGRLVDDESCKAARLRRFMQLNGPALPAALHALRARHFTTSYTCPFNDCFNRTPGQGVAGSYGGAWGSGVRSALNNGCLGAVAGEEGSAREAMLLIEPGAEDEEEEASSASRVDGGGDGGDGNGGGGKGPQQQQQQLASDAQGGSNHRRNFGVIASWALERSGGLIDDAGDVATLRTLLHGLSPQALELFLRGFHSPKPLFRVKTSRQQRSDEQTERGPELGAAVDELVQRGLMFDVAAMGRDGEAIVLTHTYDTLALLRADELAKLNDSLLGPAGKSGRGKRTRDGSLAALDAFVAGCVASPFPQQRALLRRLGKKLVDLLGECASGRFLLVDPRAGKLLRNVYALFFMCSGYEEEDAVVLLRNDLGGLRFIDIRQAEQEEGKGEASDAAEPLGITPPFRPLFDHLLALLGAFEAAVQSGDGPWAYACLHEAADFLLPPPPSSSQQQPQQQQRVSQPASAAAATSESTTVGIVDVDGKEEEEEDDDDDVIVIEPDGREMSPANAAVAPSFFASLTAAAASFSSSSLSMPVAAPHRSRPLFPPKYRGLQDLPKPLLKIVVKIFGRGIHLLERERKHAEALHYLEIVLLRSSGPPGSKQRPSLPGLAAYIGHFHTRYVLDLGHMNRPEAQIKACEAALADVDVGGEHRLFLQQKLTALAVPPRRWKTPAFPPLRAAPVLQLQLGDLGRRVKNGAGVGKSVEDRVLDCLLGESMASGGEKWGGAHCENTPYLTLFGLLCHDVLFVAGAVGAFLTPYQNAPHDLALGRGTFLAPPSRRGALARCLARIARGEAREMLAEGYADVQRRGTLCVGLDWQAFSLDALQRIAEGLGPAALRLLCETLCEDFALYSHGLPDLLLWRWDEPPAVRAVEVKGPGDSLSLAQIWWIDKLLGAGMRVEVARVTEAGGGGRE